MNAIYEYIASTQIDTITHSVHTLFSKNKFSATKSTRNSLLFFFISVYLQLIKLFSQISDIFLIVRKFR